MRLHITKFHGDSRCQRYVKLLPVVDFLVSVLFCWRRTAVKHHSLSGWSSGVFGPFFFFFFFFFPLSPHFLSPLLLQNASFYWKRNAYGPYSPSLLLAQPVVDPADAEIKVPILRIPAGIFCFLKKKKKKGNRTEEVRVTGPVDS